jgi:branched-chain amino acid transport system ATP-binding protein
MLEIRDLHAGYGRLRVLQGVSLTVGAGEIVTVIGHNGAGKTTLLRSAMGVVKPERGEVVFDGAAITGRAIEWIVRRRMVLVPEGRAILKHMTVRENLTLGGYARETRAGLSDDMARVVERFPALAPRLNQKAGTLSGGEQQMLAIGRALMGRPRLLLLDEPSLGLAPLVTASIFDTIRDLRRDGVTVLLIEQNAKQALRLADRAYVLEAGVVVLEGPNLASDARIQEAYLGA